MSSLALPSQPLLSLWRNLQSRFRFKFVLPHVRTAQLKGIKLDISSLSPLMKNFILTGRYEVQECRLATKALSRRDVVLELGGAIGFIGLYCRRVLGVKHVTSVEANPNTVQLLRRNYELNGFTPDVIHSAAAATDGELDLDIEGEFWENTLTSTSSNTVRVPARSLGSLIAAMPTSPTTLICDIEGAEQYLDFKQLPATVTKIIMELHPSMIGEAATAQLLGRLSDIGFQQAEKDGEVVWLERAKL